MNYPTAEMLYGFASNPVWKASKSITVISVNSVVLNLISVTRC